eukprot:2631529-Amphidinium_carterae.1
MKVCYTLEEVRMTTRSDIIEHELVHCRLHVIAFLWSSFKMFLSCNFNDSTRKIEPNGSDR